MVDVFGGGGEAQPGLPQAQRQRQTITLAQLIFNHQNKAILETKVAAVRRALFCETACHAEPFQLNQFVDGRVVQDWSPLPEQTSPTCGQAAVPHKTIHTIYLVYESGPTKKR